MDRNKLKLIYLSLNLIKLTCNVSYEKALFLEQRALNVFCYCSRRERRIRRGRRSKRKRNRKIMKKEEVRVDTVLYIFIL